MRSLRSVQRTAVRSSHRACDAMQGDEGGQNRIEEDRALHAIVGPSSRLTTGQLGEKKPLRGKCQLRGMLGENASRADPERRQWNSGEYALICVLRPLAIFPSTEKASPRTPSAAVGPPRLTLRGKARGGPPARPACVPRPCTTRGEPLPAALRRTVAGRLDATGIAQRPLPARTAPLEPYKIRRHFNTDPTRPATRASARFGLFAATRGVLGGWWRNGRWGSYLTCHPQDFCDSEKGFKRHPKAGDLRRNHYLFTDV